jgi:hypothetical protein
MPDHHNRPTTPAPSRDEQAERIRIGAKAHNSLVLGGLAIVIVVISAVGGNALDKTTFRNASLILFVPGLLAACALAIGSLVQGAMALSRIKAVGGRAPGSTEAIGGVGLSAASLVLAIVLFIACASWFSGHATDASAIQAIHHVKQLCAAAEIYAAAHDGRLPPADSWTQLIKTPEVPMAQVLSDRSDPRGGRPWAMNRSLAGVPLTAVPNLGQTVLFFECKAGSPPAGGRELIGPRPRRQQGYVVGFADGHAEFVPPANTGGLIWNPQVGAPSPSPGPVVPPGAPAPKPPGPRLDSGPAKKRGR